MKFRLIAIILAGLFTACGSSQKGNAEAGSSGAEAALHQKAADGTPAWVNRGSITLKSDDGRRLFFGIGVAAGIRNPAMLRTTADNRARAELGKLFSTYSASLMKDYANSGGEQHIEQAIKTFSGQTLQGVEVVDRYIAADGSLYALAQLDLQKAREAIAKAKELGVFKSYAADESLERIFDKGARKPAAPAPAPRVAADAGTDSGVENAPSSSSSVQSGEKPGWVDGECGRFPHSRYLCGVGFAKARAHAESGSYAALSRIFVAQIASVSSDFMGAYSKTGAPDLEVQSAEVLTKISTAKIFSGVQVMEVWKDKDDTIYALACLERSVAGSRLRDDIRGLDESVTKHIAASRQMDKTSRVGELSKALQKVVQRVALNGELRIVDASGIGVSNPYSHADIADALEAAKVALKVQVVAEGPYGEEFRNLLVESLISKGYQASSESDGEFDVLVKAKVQMEDGGKSKMRGRTVHFARCMINIEIQNASTKRIIGSVSDSRKEGQSSLSEAKRRAVQRLAKKLSKKLGSKIDKAMSGG